MTVFELSQWLAEQEGLVKPTKGLALEALQEQYTVRGALDKHFEDVKIDAALAKKVYQYQVGYLNTSREYLEFFSSNLLGVYVIRFSDAQVQRFYTQVLGIDFLALKEDIRKADTIDHTFKISGDIFNLTLTYLIHRALTATNMGQKARERLAYDTALVFFYRCMAAITSDWFTYPADPKIAQAAYANLSYKFLIKRLGSWHKVMDYRAKDLTSKEGLHYDRLINLESDEDLVRVINDSQGRIKDLILNYYSEFAKVHAQGDKVAVTSATIIDADGEEVLRERTRNVDAMIATIKEALTDPNSLVKQDLVKVVADINANTSFRMIRETLLWMSANQIGKEHKLVNEFVTSVVVHSAYLIDSRIELSKRGDVGYVLLQLKNFYLSSRSEDRELLKIRELGDKIIKKAHGRLSTALALSTRTAVILYLTLRVLVGRLK